MRLINCEELIRLLNDKKAKYSSSNYKQIRRGLCKAIRIAHEMDNEDAEPVRHGRLVSTGTDELYCEWGDCTVCGSYNRINAKFCNNCGARIEGIERK